MASPDEYPSTPADALAALEAGNERHRNGDSELRTHSPLAGRHAEGQRPFAAILACSDSRVSPTLAFDLDRGNLFVSRVAGNSVDAGTLGSTEYAVAVLGVKLVMVLGHSDCGAVKAAIDVAAGAADYPPGEYGSIGEVVAAVVPSIETLSEEERSVEGSVAANARRQAAQLAESEPVIRPAVERGELQVVAAVYDVETGRIELL
jgi:carbonic anhydrase